MLSPASLKLAIGRVVGLLVALVLWLLGAEPWIIALVAVTALLTAPITAVVQLAVALRPLLLPIAVAGLVAARNLPPALSAAVGVVVALLFVPWIARDLEKTRAALTGSWRGFLKYLLGVLVAVVALFLSADLTGVELGALDATGDVAVLLIATAVLALAAALVFRLWGYMRWPARRIFGGLLLLAVVRTLMWLKLVPDALGDTAPPQWWFVAAGVVLILLVAAESIVDVNPARGPRWVLRLFRPVLDRPAIERAYARGIGWSVASALLVTAALAVSWFAIFGMSQAEIEDESRRSGQPPTRPADMTAQQMRETFAPVLTFHEDQRWLPERVDTYIKGEAAARVEPEYDIAGKGLPTTCPPGTADPCYAFVCERAEDPCAHTQDLTDRKGRSRGGTSYVRVVRAAERPRDGSPSPFENDLWQGPGRPPVTAIVQYWLWYAFDDWHGGTLVQRHAGDWESVTVALGDDEPLFVAYSGHCGGQWRPWKDVRVAKDTGTQTHPLVAVAVGSHASYARAEDARSPDWSSCLGLPGESVALLSYANNIRDRTGSDFEIVLDDLIPVDARTPPMTFPGYWGKTDQMAFELFGTREIHGGAGPRTASRQGHWLRPMRKFFCGAAWRPRLEPNRCP